MFIKICNYYYLLGPNVLQPCISYVLSAELKTSYSVQI